MRRASSSVAGSTRRSSRQPSLLKPASSVLKTCIGMCNSVVEACTTCSHIVTCTKWPHSVKHESFSGASTTQLAGMSRAWEVENNERREKGQQNKFALVRHIYRR